MNNLYKLPKPFFVLAPMDDVTDVVFRQIVATCASPDLFFTEFVNVDGLQSPGRKKLLPKLLLGAKEGSNNGGQPIIAQIWGKNPENYYKTTKEIVDGTLAAETSELQNIDSRNIDIDEMQGNQKPPHKSLGRRSMDMNTVLDEIEQRTESYVQYDEGAAQIATKYSVMNGGNVNSYAVEQAGMIHNFAGVDINMGCPDKTVVKNGCCSALINNRELAGEIIQAVQDAAKSHFPVSVKTRVGFTTVDLSWIEFLLNQKLNMLTIHLRTKKDMSKVPARWDLMKEIKIMRDRISPTTLLVGNGDVASKKQGEDLAIEYGLDGIMIGRGIFNDPYIFADTSKWEKFTKQQRQNLYKSHVELFAKTWQNDERRTLTLNKFCKMYIQNFNGAKELRERLMSAQSTTELLDLLKQ